MTIENKGEREQPAVLRFSDREVACRYFEKSINGMRKVESDLTSYQDDEPEAAMNSNRKIYLSEGSKIAPGKDDP